MKKAAINMEIIATMMPGSMATKGPEAAMLRMPRIVIAQVKAIIALIRMINEVVRVRMAVPLS